MRLRRRAYGLPHGTGNKAETRLLPAPPSLNKHGAYFYDLRLTSKANASLNLYSGMGVLRATVDFVGDVKSRRLLYRISSPGGASEWVRVDLQETVYGMLYKAVTSSGKTMDVKIHLSGEEGLKEGCAVNAKTIQSFSLHNANGWRNVTLSQPVSEDKNTAKRLEKETLPLKEKEESLFTTPQLKLLYGVLLEREALAKPPRGESAAEKRFSFLDANAGTNPGAVPVSYAPQANCEVFCFRIPPTLVPTFYLL